MELIAKNLWIAAPPEQVALAITTTSGFRAWWTERCEVGGAVGEEAVFRFDTIEVIFRIERLDARGVEMTCVRNENHADWQGTHLAIRAVPEGNGTYVDLLHDGYAARNEAYERCVRGWNHHLDSLRAWCETGRGAPFGSTPPLPRRGRAVRAVADGGAGTVIATVEVPAAPERVFRALTTSELETWWGSSDTYRMTAWAADLRVGGEWRVGVRRPDGQTMPAGGQFLEIDEPRKVVQTRTYDWEHPRLGRRETTVTYRFDPIPGGTRVTVRQEGFGGLPEAADEHADGWERVLTWLEAHHRREAGHRG